MEHHNFQLFWSCWVNSYIHVLLIYEHHHMMLTWRTRLALSMVPFILTFGIWILRLVIKVIIFFSSNLAIIARSKPCIEVDKKIATSMFNMNQTLYFYIYYILLLSNVSIARLEFVYLTVHKSGQQPKYLNDCKGNKNLQMSITSSTMVMRQKKLIQS